MTKLNIKHTYRKGTPEELEDYARLRKQIEAEKPEISQRAQAAFDNAKRTETRLARILELDTDDLADVLVREQ